MTDHVSSPGHVWRERIPFFLCFLAALGLRTVDLGGDPLAASEASASWWAWSGVTPQAVPRPVDPPVSAALFGIQSFLFWVSEANDATARLGPALAGAAIVLLPRACAAAIGRGGAIVLAALLALDPLFVGYSRLADGTALGVAVAWGVLLCAGLPAASAPVTRRGNDIATIALWMGLGLLLVSGPIAWDLLVPLIAALAVLAPSRGGGRRSLALAATAALAASTSMFGQWEGPQLVSVSLGAWLRQWHGGGSRLPLRELWTMLLEYEAAIVVLGVAGLALALYRRGGRAHADSVLLFERRAVIVHIGWILWAVVLTLRPGRELSSWFALQPPLFLGVCYLLPSLWSYFARRAGERPVWAAAGLASTALVLVHLGAAGVRIATEQAAFRPYADATEPGVRHLAVHVEALRAHTARVVVRGSGADAYDPVIGWHLRSALPVRRTRGASGERASEPLILTTTADPERTRGVAAYPLRRIDGVLHFAIIEPPAVGR